MVDFKASTSADKFAALSDVETGACAGLRLVLEGRQWV